MFDNVVAALSSGAVRSLDAQYELQDITKGLQK
jgi:hypothetical protein